MIKPYYKNGSVTIYNSPCLPLLKEMKDKSIDAVVTDPPYGINLRHSKRTRHRQEEGSYEDSTDDTPENILKIVIPAIKECIRIAHRVAVTPGNRLVQSYPPANDIGDIFYPNGAGRSRWGFGCSNLVLYYGTCPYLSTGQGSRPTGVMATHWNRRKYTEHPCEKPLKMMEWLVTRTSLEGHTVLDPFCGSGTTLVAARRLGRPAIGIDIEEKYCEIAARRLENPLMELDHELDRGRGKDAISEMRRQSTLIKRKKS